MQANRLRRILPSAVILAAVVGLCLVARSAIGYAADGSPRERWYTISSADTVFGSTHAVRQVEPNGTLRFSEDSRMLVDLFGQRQEIGESFECVVKPSLEPLSFRHQSTRQSGATRAEGHVAGQELVVTLRLDDTTITRHIALSERPILGPTVADWLANSQLGVGDSAKLSVLETDSWSVNHVIARRLEDADGLRRFTLASGNGANGGTWSLSDDGALESMTLVTPDRVVRRATVQAAEKLTYLKMSNRELLTFPLNREIAFPERAERIVVRLVWNDLPFERLQLEDARQKIVKQSHEQKQYSVELALERAVTIESPAPLPVTDAPLTKYLAETPYIRPHDASIARQARQWVDSTNDSLEAVRRLSHGVSQYLQGGELIAETLSGPEVLACRKGKCTEFTTLLASLARSVGIPARVALGMRLVNGQWVGHMWCEAWVGRWIPVDASADEVGGSPALLKLTHSRTVMGTQNVRWELTKTLELKVIDVVGGKQDNQGLKTGIVGQTYTNADYACRISAPEGWTLEDQSKPGVVFVRMTRAGESKSGGPSISFVAFSLPTKLSPGVLTGARKARFAAARKDFEVLADNDEPVGVFDGRRWCYRYNGGKSQVIQTTEVVWTSERSGFLLNLIAEESVHDAMLEQFEAVLKSFEKLHAIPDQDDQQAR